jgi:putative mRNA 3-end processing factor
MTLLESRPCGLYCPAADLYIDPTRKVGRAVITHAHADHARPGHTSVLCSLRGLPLVRERVGRKTAYQGLNWGESLTVGHARISLHPAGHILGSAQVRIEVDGRVAVVTGDYKRGCDPTCEAFEPVPCHLLVSECTFGLPLYRWPDPADVAAEIDAWWQRNSAEGINSVLLGYSLGKAQRLLAMLNPERGPILVHGAMLPFLAHYRNAGIRLPPTKTLNSEHLAAAQGRAMILAPPQAQNSSLQSKAAPVRIAFASGWMLLGAERKKRKFNEGFVVSDHVDWPELLQTVEESGAEELWAAHGFREEVAAYFAGRGLRTRVV